MDQHVTGAVPASQRHVTLPCKSSEPGNARLAGCQGRFLFQFSTQVNDVASVEAPLPLYFGHFG